MSRSRFSPWVFVTYGCTCACPYCMVPKMKSDNMNMSPETFEKMLNITENIFEKGICDNAHFRLSGGEPLLAFHNYKDLVTKYKKKYPYKMNFGLLTNLTIFTNEISDWMLENNMGMQVSLDDLTISKPLNNGKSSSEITLENIEKAKKDGIRFTINTVLDTKNTKSLKSMADYISKLDNEYGLANWGLNGSYTLDDESKLEEIIEIFKDCILRLWVNNFDIYGKLRFYNSIINNKNGTCTAGINSFSIGTNLEMSSCQSLCDKKPLGYFSEDFPNVLASNPDNSYFFNSTMTKDCTFCPIIEYCRGGCRAANQDVKIRKVTCQIRKEIISFILNKIPRQNTMKSNNSIKINYDDIIKKELQDYINQGHEEVETPEL